MHKILLKVLKSDQCSKQQFSLINSNNFRLQKDFATQESLQEQPTTSGQRQPGHQGSYSKAAPSYATWPPRTACEASPELAPQSFISQFRAERPRSSSGAEKSFTTPG